MDKLHSLEGRAVLEALGSMIAVDIAQIEAMHSSNREVTMMRARGWYCSLPILSSKFVAHTINTLDPFGNMDNDNDDKADANADGHSDSKTFNKGKTRRGGGAWRAFLHANCSGTKLTQERLDELSRQYRGLSHEQKALYEEAGALATLARREGFSSFGPKISSSSSKHGIAMVPQAPQPGDEAPSGAIIAPNWDFDPNTLVHYRGPDFFIERFDALRKHINEHSKSNPDPNLLKKHELEELKQFQSKGRTEEFLNDWSQANHSFISNGFGKVGANCSSMVSMQWVPNIVKLVKASMFF